MTDTATATEESERESKKTPVKEVPVVQDQGFFQHDTGDTYDGFFEAKKKDRSAKMHGPGVYTTAEGDSYSGMWDVDRLGANEEVTITFADGSKYEGLFKDWTYVNHGKYCYPDGSILECNFTDNCPVGELVLSDPNGHTWLGRADVGFGWLEPVNHYYDMLDKIRDMSRVKRRHKSSRHVESDRSPSMVSKGKLSSTK